jgi:hypothetical protein
MCVTSGEVLYDELLVTVERVMSACGVALLPVLVPIRHFVPVCSSCTDCVTNIYRKLYSRSNTLPLPLYKSKCTGLLCTCICVPVP